MNDFLSPDSLYCDPGKSNLLLKHQTIDDFIKKSKEFFSDPESLDYMVKQIEAILGDFELKEYFLAGIGFAYPYYVLGSRSNELLEINNFHEKIASAHEYKKNEHPNGWVCGACKTINQLSDFKTVCKKCNFARLKPRQLFTMLPDVDIIIITKEDSPEVKQDARLTVNNLNLITMDYSVDEIFQKIKDTFDKVKERKKEDIFIPVDFHICTVENFNKAIEESLKDISYKIPRSSLHAEWEDNPLPFFINAVFLI